MALTRWNPTTRLTPLHETLDEFGGQNLLRDLIPLQGVSQQWMAPVDLYETPEAVIVEAVLPGVSEEDLELSVTGSTLTIRAQTTPISEDNEREYQLRERLTGRFYRMITLPTQVEADEAEALLENGILHLTLPKAEEVRPKSIQVKAIG